MQPTVKSKKLFLKEDFEHTPLIVFFIFHHFVDIIIAVDLLWS